MDRERGRENGSFPVAEILKPQGVREERSDDGEGFAAPAGICNFNLALIGFVAIVF